MQEDSDHGDFCETIGRKEIVCCLKTDHCEASC